METIADVDAESNRFMGDRRPRVEVNTFSLSVVPSVTVVDAP